MSAKWDARHMRSSSDQQLHTLMVMAVKSRDADAASGSRSVEAEEANLFACRLADELARRKAARAEMELYELSYLGIVDGGPVDVEEEPSC